MKPNFPKSGRRLQVTALSLLAGLILCPLAGMATDSIYINTGTINNANLPNVDATNFYNSGTWNITTTAPYKTAHTLNYTNEGTMNGSVGWEFDYGTGSGGRGLSANFFNDSPATIQANDGVIYNPIYAGFLASYVLVSATNIVNKGTLIAGANGQIVLTGTNVTLSRSDLEIAPITPGFASNNGTNFTPDVQIYSWFWGTNSMSLDSAAFWDGTSVESFQLLVTGGSYPIPYPFGCGWSNLLFQSYSFIPTDSDSIDMVVSTTNIPYTDFNSKPQMWNAPAKIVRQAVFVSINNPNITDQIRFSPSTIPGNPNQTVAVRLTTTLTNTVTQSLEPASIYLVDTLVSKTNFGLAVYTNIDPYYYCSGPVFCPANYILSRTDPGDVFANGTSGAGTPDKNFFYSDPTEFTNSVVQANYAVYEAYVDNLSSDKKYGAVVTNLGGRIIINANNLDLSRAGLSAQGYIQIKANNLVSSTNAIVDCQNLSYNLGSASGNLNVTNLAGLSVSRLQGNVAAWSAMWTNYMYESIPNFDTNNTPPTPIPTTNYTEIDFYALIVYADSLSNTAPVTVQDLILHSTNMTVSDYMNVNQTLLLDGPSFTLLGEINLTGTLQNWTSAVAPTLRYFTNNGTLNILNNAHFGDDTATNYIAFVNNSKGTISAGSQTINSADFEDYGHNQTTVGDFNATMQTGSLSNATISSAGNIQFFANTLQFNKTMLTAALALNFSVTTSLSDNGVGSGNVFSCNNGFNLLSKPATGDLLGTTFTTIAPARASVTHTWAGEDRGGQTMAGFTNNAAIGSLVLVAGGNGSGFQEPQFTFSGTGAPGVTNGLYVSYLDISKLTNYNFLDGTLVTINPNLIIYFANTSGKPAALDGQFGGHLIWVHNVQNNSTNSTRLFGASYNGNNGAFQFSTSNSLSGPTNIIQASTNLASTNWLNIYTGAPPFTFTDTHASNYPARFYRTKLAP